MSSHLIAEDLSADYAGEFVLPDKATDFALWVTGDPTATLVVQVASGEAEADFVTFMVTALTGVPLYYPDQADGPIKICGKRFRILVLGHSTGTYSLCYSVG